MISCSKAKDSLSIATKDKKNIELCNRYAGCLQRTLISDSTAWEVFFFLFAEKISSHNPAHSAYDICTSLNTIHQSNQPLNGTKGFSEKSVNNALDKLAMAGYIKKRKFNAKKENHNAGRPPAYLYEVEPIAKMIAKVKETFQKQQDQALDALLSLQTIEEIAAVNKKEVDE
jgi:hypothetical protein